MFWKIFIGFIRVVVIPLGAAYMIYILIMAAISIVHDEKKKKQKNRLRHFGESGASVMGCVMDVWNLQK